MSLNVTPTLTLNLILILTLPRTKNPIITLTLTLCCLRISSLEQLSPEQMSDHHADACVKEVRHGRRWSVMVWGAGWGGHHGCGRHKDGHSQRQRECGTVHDVLQPVVVHSWRGTIFIDDNAHAHRARFLHRVLEENNIEQMDPWPDQSPDMNGLSHGVLGEARWTTKETVSAGKRAYVTLFR